jgi:hypothetical protein
VPAAHPRASRPQGQRSADRDLVAHRQGGLDQVRLRGDGLPHRERGRQHDSAEVHLGVVEVIDLEGMRGGPVHERRIRRTQARHRFTPDPRRTGFGTTLQRPPSDRLGPRLGRSADGAPEGVEGQRAQFAPHLLRHALRRQARDPLRQL